LAATAGPARYHTLLALRRVALTAVPVGTPDLPGPERRGRR
jgi:hypothetical protein